MQAPDLHLTLAFLGDLDAAGLATVRQVAGEMSLPALDLRTARLEWWAHNRILWASVQSWPPELARFHRALLEGLRGAGFDIDPRPFTPHVSLARQAAQPANPGLPDLSDLPAWSVADFCLAASRSGTERAATRYMILERCSARC